MPLVRTPWLILDCDVEVVEDGAQFARFAQGPEGAAKDAPELVGDLGGHVFVVDARLLSDLGRKAFMEALRDGGEPGRLLGEQGEGLDVEAKPLWDAARPAFDVPVRRERVLGAVDLAEVEALRVEGEPGGRAFEL
jgi:hypothetical protein